MNKNINPGRIFTMLAFFSILFLNACKEKDEPVPTQYQYFVSDEFKFDLGATLAKSYLLTYQTTIPESSVFGTKADKDLEVYKITYKTTFKGQTIDASGLVCVPKAAGNYPVLCFQNGTNTLHSNAPSANPKDFLFTILESVTSMGFIVVIPDYIGFGASSGQVHPYLHAESTTQSIVDMLRAVREFGSQDKIMAKPTKELYIFGYSQGGWATMQLLKSIETSYASEFTLKASSCGAGPYSIEYMNEYITAQTDYLQPYFLTYLLNAYTAIGLVSNPVSDFIQAPYAARITGLYDGKHSGSEINAQLTTKMSDLITAEYRTQYATNSKFAGIRTAFAANSIAAWNVSTPTRLYHGANDVFIPVSMSQKMLADFKAAGVPDSKVQLIVIPGFDHATGVIPVGISTIVWFIGIKN